MGIKLSVIIPVYNSARYLEDCLNSILRQDMDDYEVICVNDGSVDRSVEILYKYVSSDKRIRILHQKNLGPGVARNKGLRAAKGEYVYFIDSDDYLVCDDAFSFMINRMEKDSLDVLYFGTELLFENEEIKKTRSSEEAWFRRRAEYGMYSSGGEFFISLVDNMDFVCTVWLQCIRREFLVSKDIEFPDIKECEDEIYTFMTMLQAGKVCHINKKLYMRRVREGSIMTSNRGILNFYDATISWRIMLNYLNNHKLSYSVEGAISTYLGQRYLAILRQFDDLDEYEKSKLSSLDPAQQGMVRFFLLLNPLFQRIGRAYLFPYHLFYRDERVVLYGAGTVGRDFYFQASHSNYLKVVGLVDKKASEMKGNLPISPLAALSRMDYDSVLIAVRDEDAAEEIRDTLQGVGVPTEKIKWDGNSYKVNDFYNNFYFNVLDDLKNKSN